MNYLRNKKGQFVMGMSCNKGKNNPMYGVCRKGHGLGRKLSEKTKEKMRQACVGRLKEKTSNWKGGQFTDGDGYVRILRPEHPRANNNGYIRRSHLVAEKILGRYLYPEEITHHENEIRDDDSPENIKVTTNGEHTSYHNKKNEKNRRRNKLGQYQGGNYQLFSI